MGRLELTKYTKLVFDLLERGRSLLINLLFTISGQKSSLTEDTPIVEKIQRYRTHLKSELKIGKEYEALLRILPPDMMNKLRYELFEYFHPRDFKAAFEIYLGIGSIAMLLLAIINAGYAFFKPGLIEENFKEMQNTIIDFGVFSVASYALKKIIRCLRGIQWLHKRKK